MPTWLYGAGGREVAFTDFNLTDLGLAERFTTSGRNAWCSSSSGSLDGTAAELVVQGRSIRGFGRDGGPGQRRGL